MIIILSGLTDREVIIAAVGIAFILIGALLVYNTRYRRDFTQFTTVFVPKNP